MAAWEEVKRLAADFQKVQLCSTTQRLSDRNCVEIISWLIEGKIIDLIFTSDGKEYLTPAQLVQDIQNELYVAGGRINLVELAKIIGVDLAHISVHLNEVLKGRKDIYHVLGQLIDNLYIIKIASEINEKLIQQGQINVSDLTIQYDLPADFLQQQVLEKHLGKLIFGKQDKNDPKVFFTESFIARSKCKIRGALAGLTRPTTVASILSHINMNERLFFSLFEQTSIFGSLTGRLSGAHYIPNIYARSQSDWVQNFYKQNNYLEFDALIRLGISDYKTYIMKQFSNKNILLLNSCCISKQILERLEADIEECILSGSYVDLQSSLPSVFNEKDINMILKIVLTTQKCQKTVVVNNFIISKPFIDLLFKKCDNLLMEKAKKAVESGQYQQYVVSIQGSTVTREQKQDIEERNDKREERRRKAVAGKNGGGVQGRETKTKPTKKQSKFVTAKIDNNDASELEKKEPLKFISFDDIKNMIRGHLEEEGLDDLTDHVTDYMLPILNEKGMNLADEIYQTTVANDTVSRRQTHNELQNKLNILIGDIRLFEKGIKLFPTDVQSQLIKYLLKTICTDVANEILNYVAAEQNINIAVDKFNHEQKIKFVNELPAELRGPMLALIKSLTGQSIDEFMITVEEALLMCSMIVKKIDKKKDRTIILNHKLQLLEQLNTCDDLGLVLHLTVLIIFTSATGCMLHASGKHVATILSFLKQYLTSDQVLELNLYCDFVTLMLSNGSEAENAKEKLKEKMAIIKSIANDFKKLGGSEK